MAAGFPSYGQPAARINQRTKKADTALREIIILECTECKHRNYTTTKEKKNTPGRFEIKKFCKFERKHTIHKECR